MRVKALISLFLCCFLFAFHAKAESNHVYSFNSSKQAERFQALIKEIRCVVCQNQNIADSNAPLANDLRDKIYHMMIEGKSDQDIKLYLVDRYGEFILLNPRLTKLTLVLWLFPFFLHSSLC